MKKYWHSTSKSEICDRPWSTESLKKLLSRPWSTESLKKLLSYITAKDQIELVDSVYKINQNKRRMTMILMTTAVLLKISKSIVHLLFWII